jgi:L-rhamnose mutarotase
MRYVFTTTVKPGKIDGYLHYHDNIWPEVAAGLRQAGLTELHIYRVPGTDRLIMVIETAGVDLKEATGPGSLYRSDPVCERWESMMDADYHGGWTEVVRVHSSDVEWNKALALPLESRFYETRPTELTSAALGGRGSAPAASKAIAKAVNQSTLAFGAGVLCGALLLALGSRLMSK